MCEFVDGILEKGKKQFVEDILPFEELVEIYNQAENIQSMIGEYNLSANKADRSTDIVVAVYNLLDLVKNTFTEEVFVE
jgi:hypothetical protein